MKNPRVGSSLDKVLSEDGILEKVTVIALQRVKAWKKSH